MPNRDDKLAIYERLVQLTLTPVGSVWTGEETAVQFAPNTAITPELAERGLAFWESLLGEYA
jgi:hypothetical protein